MEDTDYIFEILYHCIAVRKVEIIRIFLPDFWVHFSKTRCIKKILSFFETPSGKDETVGNIKIPF